ncbi:hypothetical protein HYE68_000348 [Fusarium pseudograminearum]|nr:hypothetical protein HYE68_000348 [Fusarium pseudograminearum]
MRRTSIAINNRGKFLQHCTAIQSLARRVETAKKRYSWARAEPSAEAPTYSTLGMYFHGDSHFHCLNNKYQRWGIVEYVINFGKTIQELTCMLPTSEAASSLQASDQPDTAISNMPAYIDEIVVHEKILARRVSSSHENYLICGPFVSPNMTEDLEAIPESGSSWDSWPDDDFHTQQGQGTRLYFYRD